MKGDFLGFSFDGIHCSQLGITHVSSSDRYDEQLFPEIKDKTIEIPNNHGEYYYGSTFGTRSFDINIAFDSITEKQFRNIRRLFGTTKICELIFDERPYKVYHAKIESPIELSYVCFDEQKRTLGPTTNNGVRVVGRNPIVDEETGETTYEIIREEITPWVYETDEHGAPVKQRIYKGEGSISLICYFPFAHQLFKTLDLYESNGNIITSYNNIDEWKESSGLLTEAERAARHIDETVQGSEPYTRIIPVYNPGDLNTGFCLYIPFDSNGKILPKDENSDIIINGDTDILLLRAIERKNEAETGIVINTINHLIEGVNFSNIANIHNYRTRSWQTLGTIYNECIKAGEFPYIKRNDWRLDDEQYSQSIKISCADANANASEGISIYYDYLYF